MSECAALGEEVSAPITSENTIENTRNKVEQFCRAIFPEGVPLQLRGRLTVLGEPGRISFSRSQLEAVLSEDKFRSEERNKWIGGGYFYSQDKIFLPERTSEDVLIHEMLHFISSYPDPESEVLRSGVIEASKVTPEDFALSLLTPYSHDIANKKSNEAITEVLTKSVAAGIDLKSPTAFYEIYGYIKGLQDNGELATGGSYNDYIFNTLEFFRQHLDTAGLLKELAQGYLLADPKKYREVINSRADPLTRMAAKLKGVNIFDLYQHEINKEGREEVGVFQTVVDSAVEKFLQDKKFDLTQKEAIAFFRSALAVSDQYHVVYLHPEHGDQNPLLGRGFIEITAGSVSREAGKEFRNLPEIKINLGINKETMPLVVTGVDGKDKEVGGEFKFDCQLQAYFLWQGLKLQHLAKGGIIYDADRGVSVSYRGEEVNELSDIDIYRHPVMKDYLSRLTVNELGFVLLTIKKMTSRNPWEDEEAFKEILQQREARGFAVQSDFIMIDSENPESEEVLKEVNGIMLQNGINRLPKIEQGKIWYFPRMNRDLVSRFNS